MATARKIDANRTSTRFAEQTDINVEPAGPWFPLEPNSFSDFGGQVTAVSRDPINADRMDQFGSVTDLDASGGMNHDLTNDLRIQNLMQGLFFADMRKKSEFGLATEDGVGVITSVSGANQYAAAAGLTIFEVGRLIFARFFTTPANNGLKRVTVSAAALVTVAETLVAEAAPPADAFIQEVGFQGTAGDIDVDNAGSFPALTSTVLNFTTLGLIPGEWVYVGGDAAGTFYPGDNNNGWKRVRSIAAGRMEFDKIGLAMSTFASTTETIQVFYGRCIKNELEALIKRRLYNIERTLGAPDPTLPAQIQAEYIVDQIFNEFSLNLQITDKATFDVNFIGCDHDTRTGVIGVKTGTRPLLRGNGLYNDSSGIIRLKIAPVTASPVEPSLFGFATELTIKVSNGGEVRKALANLGGFEITIGNFKVEVTGSFVFQSVAALAAVRNNTQATIDCVMVQGNQGIAIDLPLGTMSDARAGVEKDNLIAVPITFMAANGAGIVNGTQLNHVMMMNFFPYLPNRAAVQS